MDKDRNSLAYNEFMIEFVGESDRAAVILGAAKIDAHLGELLKRHLLPNAGSQDDLLEGDSPLATFSARIRICNRLGIIDPQFAKLLHTFRRLRNSFAHEIDHSDFTVGRARDRVSALSEPFAKTPFFQRMLGGVAKQMNRSEEDTGVVFRAVLGVFYLELEWILGAIEPVADRGWDGIVEGVKGSSRRVGRT